MTYSTPTDYFAHMTGVSTDAYEASMEAAAADEQELFDMGQPNVHPWHRRFVSESDMAYGQDHEVMDDLAAWEGMGR